jgi:hypothetical protein
VAARLRGSLDSSRSKVSSIAAGHRMARNRRSENTW